MKIENAEKEDARDLAYLINMAGEGLPYYLWSKIVTGDEHPFDIGEQRASREEGGFSYKNARVVRCDSDVVGMIIDYRLDDPYETGELDEYPEPVRPLVQLESKAPGSWYVNAIATVESQRGQGIASSLLQEAEEIATKQGISQMSLIVSSENDLAKALYTKLGYETRASLPVVDYPGCLHGGYWELMTKDLSGA